MRAILMVLVAALVALLPTASQAASISSRSGSTCAINNAAPDSGKLYCWGNNANCSGATGVCTGRTSYPTPKVTSGVVSVARFYQGACFITTGGALKCWGNNATGAIGLDPAITPKSPTPVQIFASGIASVAEGWEHVCAVTTGGAVKCWGSNAHGQLGNGTLVSTHVPQTPIASGALSVATAGSTSCARMNDNTVKCWGLHHGNASPAGAQLVPTTVAGLAGVISLGAGDSHLCVSNSGVKCWGDNSFGQFGNNTTASSATPVPAVTLTSGVLLVTGGLGQTCARKNNNTAWCWGSNNLGSLGDGTQTDRLSPTQISGLTGTTLLTVGSDNACSLSTGGYHCWGDGTFRQNGAFFDGTWPSNPRLTPFAFYFWGGP